MTHFGLDSLNDPLLLAKRKIARSIQASSYDRRGGNHDWSNFVRREGKAAVMMESAGPGCITRIWTADPQKGTIRIFIDGNPVPAIECPFARLFDLLPLSHGVGGESKENHERSKAEQLPMGHTSYCPIPFQHHCKVTIEPEDDYLYYHVNAHLFPPGTDVGSFSLETESIQAAVREVDKWSAGDPLVDMSGAHEHTAINLPPGEELVLLDAEGSGVVRGLTLMLNELPEREAEHVKDNVWLIAHFDDDEPRDASVRAPIGPMFLDYGQEVKPRSLFIGQSSEGELFSYFPMPYRNRAKIRLVNRSILPITVDARIKNEKLETFDDDLFRFRATYHVETPFGPDHRDYGGVACRLLNLDGFHNVEFLYAFGAGHFVGVGFKMDFREGPTDRAACEGDEMFFIDDDPRLTMYGTGAEDYTNDAWGIRGYVGPLSGDAVIGGWNEDIQICGYRIHAPDPVPFTRSGRFTIEHGTGNNCSGVYRSVAYWYMDPSLTRTRVEERRWEAIRNGERQMNQEEE